MKNIVSFNLAITLLLFATISQAQTQASKEKLLTNAAFTIKPDRYGIGELLKTNDVHPTDYIRRGRVFGEVIIRYISNRKLDTLKTPGNSKSTFIQDGKIISSWSPDSSRTKPLGLSQIFSLQGNSLEWTITLDNHTANTIRIEDLALPFSYNSGGGENPKEIFEERVVKHHFISGNNSFIFWQRPTGLGPFLLMIPLPGTSLEYFSTASPGEGRGVFQAFIHSSLTGNKENRGTWRQPHTSTTIEGNSKKTYGFKFRWAKDYNDIRDILASEGLIDVQVMPGMSVPTNLEATIALRTNQKILNIIPEYTASTRINKTGTNKSGANLYKIKFSRLGENRLTILYGNNYKTYLEFFVTETLETLYKKRAAFIANNQQHRDHSKWYDGLFGPYDMKNAQLRGPDNADYFDTSRLSYVLTCDDPGLCKAPFIAAKNVFYPDQKEINAIEYYIKNFVWGKLQRTDKELPYPYGVYGTPSWIVNRDTTRRRRNTNDPNRERMHTWRSYDYPHIMMMYYHMYQIASLYPNLTHYLDKKGYLERAKETAKAYFVYPYEILPWYETYKWGCYNELLLMNLIADLKKEGFTEDAKFLTSEWEKKVKYFLYDDPYPFRSEYAIDATAFESSYALAKYGAMNTMQPDSNLWFDKNLKRWYSHPKVSKEDAIDFMKRQLNANMALRGCIEPAYYYLGSDFRGRSDGYTLSYMSQMGGWGILDYALNFSKDPADYIRLGYQSYLSSFALINSGTPESNYGFWYPGPENDGASGWAFEPQKYATTWIQKPQGRGPWFYDGEIDLGFGGATRMAATIVTNDPVFGRVAYGGDLSEKNNLLFVIPKDGKREKLYFREGEHKIDIELNRDGFESNHAVVIAPAGKMLEFSIENRTKDTHELVINTKGLNGNYTVKINGTLFKRSAFDGQGSSISIPIKSAKPTHITFSKL